MDNKKYFSVKIEDQEKKFAVVRPNHKVQQKGTLVYNRSFREAADNGSLLRKNLKPILRNQGLWDDSREEQYKELTRRLLDSERRLAQGGIKMSEANQIARKMIEDREKLRELNRDYNDLDGKTAEAFGDNARYNYLVSACTLHADTGKPYFSSFEAYEDSENDPVAVPAANALGTLLYNLQDNYEQNLPENRFLIKYGFMNQECRFVRKTDGRLIDEEGRLVNEEGRLVNEKNHLVDIYGNLIDEDGEYIVTFSPFLDDDGLPVELGEVAPVGAEVQVATEPDATELPPPAE